jgi:hypothetical protein
MSGSVLLHRQRCPEDLQQLLAWYKVRDLLLGQNRFELHVRKALELASVCELPNAVWLTKLFGGCREEVREVFLGCENDPRALCLAGMFGGTIDEVFRAADLGDAFAQARVASRTVGEESFGWAEKSAVGRTRWFLLAWILLPKWNWMRPRRGKSKRELFGCR